MKSVFILNLLLIILLVGGCLPEQDLETRLTPLVEPYHFSIAGWELRALTEETAQLIFSQGKEPDTDARLVIDYFSSPERDVSLTDTVEKIIKKQIRDTLSEQGIFNPLTESEFSFPPLNFRMEELPHLLVISPRDRIESVREVTLKQDLNTAEMEKIEAGVDELGVSSLVVNIGGIATYPSLVDREGSLRFALDAVTEEWLHQYLAFTPLGFRYLLDLSGIARNYEIATMNESLVGIVSKEIGDMVYEKYYSEYEHETAPAPKSEFDFNSEMREIRKTVDAVLARGEIEQAEQFMEQKRQELASKGYYIRKLNQAYFAFHGTYAHEPAFISPIGLELRELRNRSASLKDFLDTAASMTGRQDLSASVR